MCSQGHAAPFGRVASLGTAVLHCSKVVPEGHSPQNLFHLASECMVASPILSNGLFCSKCNLRGRFGWYQLFTCVSTAEWDFFLSSLSLWDIRRLLCNYFEMHKIEEKLTSSPASYKLIVLLPDQVLHLFEKKHEAGY